MCVYPGFGVRRGAGADTHVCPYHKHRKIFAPLFNVLKVALSVGLLLCVLSGATLGQAALSTPSGPSRPSGELYGGIELSDEGVKAIALQVSQGEDESGFRVVYSEIIRLRLGRRSDGEFPQQVSADAARAVSTAQTRLRQQYRVPPERIYFIGSSRLGANHPPDLITAIRRATGLTLTFLAPATEVQMSIAGTIPRTQKVGATLIDNRNTSVLIHIGAAGTQGGYEMLKSSRSGSPSIDFVVMNIPLGLVSYTNEISRAVGPSSSEYTFTRQVKASGAMTFRQALRREIESKPGLAHRKRVFLTGPLVWAMATMLYPEDRESFVPLTYDDITQFAESIARSPRGLAYPNLSSIRDRKLRQEIEQELEEMRATFEPKQLIAGAEMLKAAAEELKWQDKTVMFARLGHLGSILSHIRLQTGK